MVFAILIALLPLAIGHQDDNGLDDAFWADESTLEASMQKVLQVLAPINSSGLDAKTITSQGFSVGSNLITAFQNTKAIQQLGGLLEENEDLQRTLDDVHKSGTALTIAATKKIKAYTQKIAKTKKGKFAMTNELNKLKGTAISDVQDGIWELQEQRSALEQQIRRQSQWAALQGFGQLVSSLITCEAAVTSYHKHAQERDQWKKQMDKWLATLQENREFMQMVLDSYKQDGEWDVAKLSVINMAATEVMAGVKAFNTMLVEAQKTAKSNRIKGALGVLSNGFTTSTNVFAAIANPVGTLGYAGAALFSGASTVADGVTAYYAHVDVIQIGESLVQGKALLIEASHQVEVLKKGRKMIMKYHMKNSHEATNKRRIQRDEI